MGAGQSCVLDNSQSVCDISKCIVGVNGYASDSDSPTDIWICTLKDGTTLNGMQLGRVVLKIGVVPDQNFIRHLKFDHTTLTKRLGGFKYEIGVYDKIITPLVENNVCPIFLRSLLVSENCTFSNLSETLKVGAKTNNDNIGQRIIRTLDHIVAGQTKPNIHDPLLKTYDTSIGNDLKFMILATEFNEAKKYNHWLASDQGDVASVLLQLLTALYSMECCKLCHNDLHSGNIFIQPIQETQLQYVVDGIQMSFITRHKAMVYDWDRASCVRFGENPISSIFGNSEVFEPNRDLAQFAASLINDGNFDRSGLGAVIEKTITTNPTNWSRAKGSEIQTPILEIIKSVYQKIQRDWRYDVQPYFINKIMFDKDGRLIDTTQRSEFILKQYGSRLRECEEDVGRLKHNIDLANDKIMRCMEFLKNTMSKSHN